MRMGAMKGPRSFATAGEIADGAAPRAVLLARGLRLHGRARPDRAPSSAGRDFDDLDMGAWGVTVVSEDSAAAKRAARILVAFYISSMPPEQVARHGIDAGRAAAGRRGARRRRHPEARRAFKPEYAEKLSLAGTPEEIVEKIRTDIQPAGVNHMILALSDAALVKMFTGEDVPNVPDINGQLKLVADRVMPAFSPALH